MLEAGSMADNPGWGAAGGSAATGNVAALLPAPDLLAAHGQ